MARRTRRGAKGGLVAAQRILRFAEGYGLVIAALVLVASMGAGFYIRYMPFKNYEKIVANIDAMGLKDVDVTAKFGAMDPLIEYWLAKYLHDHGLGSWSSLHPPNPAVMKFWYPWGRDFSHSAKPFIPFIGAEPPSGLGVADWVSLLPPIFGSLMVLMAFLYMYSRYGRIAAVFAALLASVLPSSIIRTYAGFVEKVGIALPFLILSLWLFSEALKRDSLLIALVSGVAGGAIAFIWGGYLLAGLVAAVSTVIAPLSSSSRSEARRKLLTGLTTVIGYGVSLYIASLYISISYKYIALPILIVVAFAVIYEVLGRILVLQRSYTVEKKLNTIYAGIIIASIISMFFIAPYLGISGKYYYALLGPLRGIIHGKLGVIEFTVAENNPPRPQLLLHRMNVILFLAPIAALYLFYIALRRKEAWHLPLAISALGFYHALLGMAYFEQVASVFGVMASAAMLGLIARTVLAEASEKRRFKGWRSEAYEVLVFSAILIAALLATGVVAGAYVSAEMVKDTSPIQLDMPSMNLQQYGWLYLLHVFKNNTTEDTVIVSWWDYGYLITVGSGRATVADGATMNATQIKLLAKFFTTTDEDKASNILQDLHLKPGKTLVLVHEAVLYNPVTGAVIYAPQIGDIAKSSAMLLIAGVLKIGERLTPSIISHYTNSTIYRMFVSAPYYMNTSGVVFVPFKGVEKGFNVSTVYVAGLNKGATKPYKFSHFKPYLVLISPFIDRHGRVIVQRLGNDVYQLGMLYAVYEWTG